MNKYVTQGIVLGRTDYGEADRIITFLTPAHGKIKVIAKGVRKTKSKLAGGVELFSVSDLIVLKGRGEIDTLMSTRLVKYYSNIVKDLDRTGAAYELIKLTDKATEGDSESGYFDHLNQVFIALDDAKLDPLVIKSWFQMRSLDLAGHRPDLDTDTGGAKLAADQSYNFDLERMTFAPVTRGEGLFTANDIKFMRFGFAAAHPQNLARVTGAEKLAAKTQPLLQSMLKTFFRV